MEIELTYKLTCTNDKADELVAESLEAHFVTLIGLGMKDQISFRLTLPEDQIELKGLLLGKFLVSMCCLLPVGSHLISIKTD